VVDVRVVTQTHDSPKMLCAMDLWIAHLPRALTTVTGSSSQEGAAALPPRIAAATS
jgi:hypothetical protein